MNGLRDEEWGTELGRLFLEKTIFADQYAAGKRWAEEVAEYRGVIGARGIKAGGMEPGTGGHDPDPDSHAGLELAKAERRIIARFDASHKALTDAGNGAKNAVRCVCEDNEILAGAEARLSLACGLTALAKHYASTNRRR
jgi:hypothetical protein